MIAFTVATKAIVSWLAKRRPLVPIFSKGLIVKTPTPTQHNGWVWHENDFTPPPTTHRKLNVGNISAVTGPILMKL